MSLNISFSCVFCPLLLLNLICPHLNYSFLHSFYLFLSITVGGPFPSAITGGGNGTILQELSSYDKDFISVCDEVSLCFSSHFHLAIFTFLLMSPIANEIHLL